MQSLNSCPDSVWACVVTLLELSALFGTNSWHQVALENMTIGIAVARDPVLMQSQNRRTRTSQRIVECEILWAVVMKSISTVSFAFYCSDHCRPGPISREDAFKESLIFVPYTLQNLVIYFYAHLICYDTQLAHTFQYYWQSCKMVCIHVSTSAYFHH